VRSSDFGATESAPAIEIEAHVRARSPALCDADDRDSSPARRKRGAQATRKSSGHERIRLPATDVAV